MEKRVGGGTSVSEGNQVGPAVLKHPRDWRSLARFGTNVDKFLLAQIPETFRAGMTRALTTSYPDTRREHHPAALRVCELPCRQPPRRLRRLSPPRPRTRFLARATLPHSPNPHLGHWTIPANLPIARPPALPIPPARMPPYPRFRFSPEPVFYVRPPFSYWLSFCRRPSFSPPLCSELPSSSPMSSWKLPSS